MESMSKNQSNDISYSLLKWSEYRLIDKYMPQPRPLDSGIRLSS
jgi:hypothetical protein